ncbi:28S ribosomal protein S15, mitochondrial [Toxocara canis]|uniref:Small ribosomal subunit protein uS15m n=1 Tax=Toxocara canis TaxID=6265 RepID=A0A0B2VWR1_TOXCA|nr:28S ribosomal protein S15, mitochondrial [Toxocara canis]
MQPSSAVLAGTLRFLQRGLHVSAFAPRARRPFFNIHKKVTDPARQDPEYFEKAASALPLDDNYVDALGKLYAEKVGSEREVMMKGEDRLIGKERDQWLPAIDESAPRMAYAHVDALTAAPDFVKRIFSIEYGTRRDLTDAWKNVLIGQVKRHELDSQSLEMRIGWLTSLIRHWSLLVDEINNTPKKPTWLTHRIFLMINFRRKLLRKLRETDSAAFERVLSELKIAYHVPKLPEQMTEKRRKAWAEAQLKSRIEREKEARLTELHKRFTDDREKYEKEIDEKLVSLELEKKKIEARLKELDSLQGRMSDEFPRYQPSLIGSISERTIHGLLFYHPKPLMGKRRL